MTENIYYKFYITIKNRLKKEGIEITSEVFGDGCGLVELGENGVVWFWVKGLENYKFGIWFTVEDRKICATCFAQYKLFINKFKPSYSGLRCREYLYKHYDYDEYNLEEFELYELDTMIKFMKKHPVKAYYIDQRQLEYSWELFDYGNIFNMISDIYKEKQYRRLKEKSYEGFQKYLKKLGNKYLITAYYRRDILNTPPVRCNDTYYILCKDSELKNKIYRKFEGKDYATNVPGQLNITNNDLHFALECLEQYMEEEPEEGSEEYNELLLECLEDLAKEEGIERMMLDDVV